MPAWLARFLALPAIRFLLNVMLIAVPIDIGSSRSRIRSLWGRVTGRETAHALEAQRMHHASLTVSDAALRAAEADPQPQGFLRGLSWIRHAMMAARWEEVSRGGDADDS